MPQVKVRLARAFLKFLDEHGDYRTQLEEAAVRAAAAEANSLFAKDRRGRKKKKRRGKLLKDGQEDEESLEGLPSPDEEYEEEDMNELPEDPYEQIQFYFRTFKHRTQLQIEERLEDYRTFTKNWMHDELHHPARVPISSGGMLAVTCLLWMWRARKKKIAHVARLHGILAKKLQLKDYLHSNLIKGRVMLRYSTEGGVAIGKLREKAKKAEDAALASMRPYQRKKYERFCKLEKLWEWCVTGCLLLGMFASGMTLALSLKSLHRGDSWIDLPMMEGEKLDGHIYSLDGPVDSDGYPVGMQELAEVNYAACLVDAESNGVEDPTTVCDINTFFNAAAANVAVAENEEALSSSIRSKINTFLTMQLHIPPTLADYLTALQTQTLAYLSSLLTFLLFLSSHYVAHKIHVATMNNDPMKNFVMSATDKSVKADGTVVAKRGESEAQRKRRERMLQNERLKSQMAQLAAEAKQKVAERRARMEGAEAAEKEKEVEEKKVVEELEEIVKMHSRQYGMIKAGVPQGAILNTFLAEGIENEEGKEIIEKLRAIKVRRAKEAEKVEEAEAKKLEDEKKAEEEKERIAAERLRMMKKNGGGMKKRSSIASSKSGGVAPKPSPITSPTSVGGGGGNSIASATSTISSKKSFPAKNADPATAKSAMLGQIGKGGGLKKKSVAANPASAKSAMLGQIGQGGGLKKKSVAANPANAKTAMLGQIGQGGGLKKKSVAANPASAKSAMLGQIGQGGGLKKKSATSDPAGAKSAVLGQIGQGGGLKKKDSTMAKSAMLGQIGGGLGQGDLKSAKMRKTPTKVESYPTPRPGSSTVLSGNLSVGAKSDKRRDRETKTWVSAAIAKSPNRVSPGSGTPRSVRETPKKSNKTTDAAAAPVVRRIPSRLKLGDDDEEKKGEEESNNDTMQREGFVARTLPSTRQTMPRNVTATPAASTVATHAEAATPAMAPAPSSGEAAKDETRSSGSSSVTPALALISSPADETVPSPMPAASMLSSAGNDAFDALSFRPSARAIRASATPAMVGISSNDATLPSSLTPNMPAASQPSAAASNNTFDALSFRRPSARDIMATISAVENAPDTENEIHDGEVDSSSAWMHSPAFETALQNSNASWDRRPNSKDVIARIRAVEQFEEAKQQQDEQEEAVGSSRQEFLRRGVPQAPQQSRSSLNLQQGEDSLAIIDEGQNIDPSSSFEFRRKASRTGDNIADDEISELSEPSYITAESNALYKGRSIPQALEISPMGGSMVSALSPMMARRKVTMKDKTENLDLPPMKPDVDQEKALEVPKGDAAGGLNVSIKSDAASGKNEEPAVVKVETEEERKRRERAEARAKKMEAIAARRNTGKDNDDDESIVSGMSKRHRMRRKKKTSINAAILPEESGTSVKSLDTTSETTPVKVETEEERQRKKRAEARAKKLDAMAACRNAGEDDGSTVTGISRRHRVRRKKSMLAAINPEDQERNEWKSGIFASVLGAEQVQWKRSVYGHVLNAEATRIRNLKEQRKLEEQNAAARRRLENQRRLDQKAKKFAARAERFHKMRRDGNGGDDDDGSVAGSVVSSASKHRRRRRGRKSMASTRNGSLAHAPVGEEELVVVSAPVAPTCSLLTVVEKEKQEREQWCSSIYATVMQAEQSQWKNNIYDHAIHAEEAKKQRLEMEAQLVKDNAAADARREKERQNELRAKKMEKIKQIRGAGGAEKMDDDDQSVASTASTPSSLKKMRNRRRKAARKSVSKNLSISLSTTAGMRNKAVMPLAEETVAAASEAAKALAPKVLTVEEREKRERSQWCKSVYVSVLQAEKCQWKTNIYCHVLRAEESRNKRREKEARVARELAVAEARMEKERQNKLRAVRMEKIKQLRGAGGLDENISPTKDVDDERLLVSSTVSPNSSSLKKMRDRRRRAAKKSIAK